MDLAASDRACWWLVETGAVGALILGAGALAMAHCRQPARRVTLARLSLLATFALAPLRLIAPADRPILPAPAPGAPAWWLVRAGALSILGGAAFGLAGLGLSAWALRRLAGDCRPPRRAVRRLWEHLAPRRRARPRLLVSERLGVPALVGALRPSIILPAALESGPRPPLRLALLHELAHARRGDHRWAPISALVRAVWWPVPFGAWIDAQMRLDQELLADCDTALGFGAPADYAARLLDQAATSSPVPGRPGAAPPRPSPPERAASGLSHRILMLLRCPFRVEPSAPRLWRGAALCGTLLALGLASGLLPHPRPLGAPDRPLSPAAVPAARQLRVPRLVVEGPSPRAVHPRPGPILRPLPDQFDLSFDIQADPDDLPRLRVAGLPLGPVAGLDGPAATRLQPLPVTIRHDAAGTRLTVAGHRVALGPDAQPDPSLTFEIPALRSVLIQNLHLRW